MKLRGREILLMPAYSSGGGGGIESSALIPVGGGGGGAEGLTTLTPSGGGGGGAEGLETVGERTMASEEEGGGGGGCAVGRWGRGDSAGTGCSAAATDMSSACSMVWYSFLLILEIVFLCTLLPRRLCCVRL